MSAPEQAGAAHDDWLARARELVEHVELGNADQARQLVDDLARMRESELFQEIGKLTRELHEALNAFLLDGRLGELARKDIPDAKERLSHVINLTEQSAHRTLNAVEAGLPVAEALGAEARRLGGEWTRFRRRELSAQEFRELAQAVDGFLDRTGGDAEALRGELSEILMAQDFQDLSGQVIRRVIRLVQDLEESLVGLLRVSGDRLGPAPRADGDEARKGTGPSVPGVDGGDVVQGQDEVDDLLSSLGF